MQTDADSLQKMINSIIDVVAASGFVMNDSITSINDLRERRVLLVSKNFHASFKTWVLTKFVNVQRGSRRTRRTKEGLQTIVNDCVNVKFSWPCFLKEMFYVMTLLSVREINLERLMIDGDYNLYDSDSTDDLH
jgi:hypothetical protein